MTRQTALIPTKNERALAAYRLVVRGSPPEHIAKELDCTLRQARALARKGRELVNEADIMDIMTDRTMAIDRRLLLFHESMQDYYSVEPDAALPEHVAALHNARGGHLRNASTQATAIEELGGLRGRGEPPPPAQQIVKVIIQMPDGTKKPAEELAMDELDVAIAHYRAIDVKSSPAPPAPIDPEDD